MAPVAPSKKTPVLPLVLGSIIAVVLIAAAIYLSQPATKPPETGASTEAKQYLPYLALSDVSIQATENFMKQQVIEVKGKITDNGPRALSSVEVYCLFYSVNGKEIHRERLPILGAKGPPLHSGETRPFRLPFDAVPDGWNQALPKMVIAQIKFAS